MLEGKRTQMCEEVGRSVGTQKGTEHVSKYLVFLATVPFLKLFTFFELTHLFLTNDLST